MIRRQARLRREYIYRKSVEDKERTILEKKERLKNALDENSHIPEDLQEDAIAVQKTLDWDDKGADGLTTHIDDEYKWAGVEDPKIMVTTSRDPSSKLKQFAKEIRLMFPNSQRINRGNYEVKQLVDACRANDVTDLILLHEHRGVPDGLIVCHLPYGPTGYFNLSNVVMRHDIPDVGKMSEAYPHLARDGLIVCHLPYGPTGYFNLSNVVMRHDIPDVGKMSEAYPHLIFNKFSSKLGRRVMNILKYLFPVPKDDSRRILTFSNDADYISFRHHVYKKTEGGKDIELQEVGPRFEMKIYQIIQGTLENADSADVEWVYRPYMNTAKKRKFLAD